jgi:heme/copper-type cytochrome/quinol oxidase subunit 3
MAIFIATETMFFAALVSAFLVLRAQAMAWPPFDQPRLPVALTAANGLLLLASAWTFQRGYAALRQRREGLVRWLRRTWLLGATFLAVQGFEWVRMVHHGLTTESSLYGASFYTLVGAHALHVLAALVVLAVVLRRAATGHFQPGEASALEPYRLFWFFVVAVWPLLYVLVYLA